MLGKRLSGSCAPSSPPLVDDGVDHVLPDVVRCATQFVHYDAVIFVMQRWRVLTEDVEDGVDGRIVDRLRLAGRSTRQRRRTCPRKLFPHGHWAGPSLNTPWPIQAVPGPSTARQIGRANV